MSNVKLTTCSNLCLLVILCGAGSVRAYDYTDDFTTGKAEQDAYHHSTFWSKEGVPPSEPYLYYTEINHNRCLAFADNSRGQKAELRYRFPLVSVPAARAFKGSLTLEVSSNGQDSPGPLEYQTSPDGTVWSTAQVLDEGRHDIPLTSAGGVCYILFSGARVTIDNIVVSLNSPPVTIRVPQDFATIQAAIDNANDGDVIELAKRTYRGPGNRDIDFQGKAITVRGAGNAKETIIDCEGLAAKAEGGHRGFYFHRLEGPDSVVSDLTIQGGRVFGSQVPPNPLPGRADPIGGGIYCAFSGPTIANCIIEDCGAELGGGIGGVGATPKIVDCTIEECIAGGLGTATSGGRGAAIALIGNSNATIGKCIIRANAAFRNSYGAGLYFQQSAATVAGCTISQNTAQESVRGGGGGAYCSGASTDVTASVTFRNCIFSKNEALAGAGICVEGGGSSPRCRVNVVNCTIAQNELLPGAVTGAAGGIQSSGADVVVTSSILWGNGKALVITGSTLANDVSYSDIEGGYSGPGNGPGNINADPYFADPKTEDYHLKSMYGRYDPTSGRVVSDLVQSPCIDRGDPSASVGEEPPPNGNRINMGAYGGTKEASQSPQHSTFHVDQNGSSGLMSTFRFIQDAIDAAEDGDTVLVWPGAYKEDLDFGGKAITVKSAADAAMLSASKYYGVTFELGEGGDSVLMNFVISGCPVGILCTDGASPTLKNLTIVGNGTGILAIYGSDPNITNCILWYNRDADLFGEKGGPKPRFSNIERNTADKAAGNIQLEPMFADRTISDYHLMSQRGRYVASSQTWVIDTRTSPCIDAGNPGDDYRAEPMPNGGRIDMGAHGGTPYASKSIR